MSSSRPASDLPTFQQLGVPNPLVKVLARQGIAQAFAIQADSLRDSLAGHDLLGRASTGSGKTLAFAIPLVARLGVDTRADRGHGRPVGLVLAPTRELATQIAEVVSPLAQAYGLKITTIFGGVAQRPQERALQRGVDIVVACPGRLEDLMGQGLLRLDEVEVTVLDEADFMADLGFLPAVTRILRATPAHGQRMLFSATLDGGVDQLVAEFLHDPREHAVNDLTDRVAGMTHHVLQVESFQQKKPLVTALAGGRGQSVLFVRTRHGAVRLAQTLRRAGIPAVDLQGDLSQATRDDHLARFASGRARVLVATDVAARGVDVPGVGLVVHVDPAADAKTYLHRSGRTARAGRAGHVVSVILGGQAGDLRRVIATAGVDAEIMPATADSAVVAEIAGPPAPRRDEVAERARHEPEAQQSEGRQPKHLGAERQLEAEADRAAQATHTKPQSKRSESKRTDVNTAGGKHSEAKRTGRKRANESGKRSRGRSAQGDKHGHTPPRGQAKKRPSRGKKPRGHR
ncbi:DEAD/DEAH box helicase [Pseudoclavibacter soli]|uniref:DEAD/DEAH box helicase n=1 Tax=Pseudoclavibacter soli TaxID=452623 RepID=UPI000408862A|nr:DEAD/DEAH box helicase [Pseudoclavibacter soli]